MDTHRKQLYQLGELLQTIAENPEPVQEDFEGELDKVEVKVSALLEQVESSIGGGTAMKEKMEELLRNLADARKLSKEADGVLDEAEVAYIIITIIVVNNSITIIDVNNSITINIIIITIIIPIITVVITVIILLSYIVVVADL